MFDRAKQSASGIVRIGVALYFVVTCHAGLHADWPHLRGPNYDGVSSEGGVAESWPASGPPRLWSRDLGQGYSGFIFADGRLYTQRQSLGGQFLLCLDPDSGAALWEHRYDWAWQPKGAYPGPYASPTFYRGKVFFASADGLVGCVDAKTGTPIWSLNVREKFAGKGFGFGYAATPLVEDDKVILPVGGAAASLVALHVDDGRTVWTAGADPASYCPALPITFAGRRCVVGYLQNAMILVELATGKLLARQSLSSGYDEHSAWPIWREPNLLLAGPFRVPATRLELSHSADGGIGCKTQWLSKELANDVVSSVLYEKHLYGFDLKQLQASAHRTSRGTFKCVDWDTGKLAWATDEVGHASVLVADGKLILFNDTGTLILARADPTAYHELARATLFDGEICWTPPLLVGGKLFVRSPSQMVCVNVGRMKLEAAPNALQPSAGSWRVDPSWLLTREREFPNDAPTWDEMTRWHAAGMLVLGGAGLAALGVRLISVRAATPAFFVFATLFGFLGTNAISALADECLFTWPAILYAALHAAVLTCWHAHQNESRRTRWLARLGIAVFLLAIYLYFEACKAIGMFVAWSFLIGFPAAVPFAFLAAHAALKQQRLWIIALWTLLAFTAFFWTAQVFLLWKSAA